MEHPQGGNLIDIWVGLISGMICGVIKFLDIYLLADPYMVVLLKVFFTAVIGGFGGVAGKHLWTYCVRKWKEKFNKK